MQIEKSSRFFNNGDFSWRRYTEYLYSRCSKFKVPLDVPTWPRSPNQRSRLKVKDSDDRKATDYKLNQEGNERTGCIHVILTLPSQLGAGALLISDAMVTLLNFRMNKLADKVHALEVTCSSLRDQIPTYERLKEPFRSFKIVKMRMERPSVELLRRMQDGLAADARFSDLFLTFRTENSKSARVESIIEHLRLALLGTVLISTMRICGLSLSNQPPIALSTDDYEIVHTDGQEGTDADGSTPMLLFRCYLILGVVTKGTDADGQTSTGADANPFPCIDDVELNVPE
ncbi:hypothetical protein Tco_0385211 [Tanacetum coccineum]